jgi:hypothetical protein
MQRRTYYEMKEDRYLRQCKEMNLEPRYVKAGPFNGKMLTREELRRVDQLYKEFQQRNK